MFIGMWILPMCVASCVFSYRSLTTKISNFHCKKIHHVNPTKFSTNMSSDHFTLFFAYKYRGWNTTTQLYSGITSWSNISSSRNRTNQSGFHGLCQPRGLTLILLVKRCTQHPHLWANCFPMVVIFFFRNLCPLKKFTKKDSLVVFGELFRKKYAKIIFEL